MSTLKTNWLSAILFSILGLGISFGTNASTDKENPKTVKKEVKAKNTKKALTTTMWFDLNVSSSTTPANPNDTDAEIIGEGSPTPSCQPTNTADVCGIELDVTDILASNPGYVFDGKTVQQLLNDGAKHIPTSLSEPKSYSRRP